jgi:CheY-like chemotaxis protein
MACKVVLVVDDEPSIRKLLVKALEAQGYHAVEAADGLEAAEQLGCLEHLPDLILCDVKMPKVDGFSLAKLVRGRAELRAIPIIFLTCRVAPADVTRGMQLGARYYVSKPFSTKELLNKVQLTLG